MGATCASVRVGGRCLSVYSQHRHGFHSVVRSFSLWWLMLAARNAFSRPARELDPSRSPRAGLVTYAAEKPALPPVGQVVQPSSRPSTASNQRCALSQHGDATYFEVLEADVLAAQKRLRALPTPPDAPSVRLYSERELQHLREAGGAAGKLALQEVLSERMAALELAAVQAFSRRSPATYEIVEANLRSQPPLSRLASLVALLDTLEAVVSEPPRAASLPHGVDGTARPPSAASASAVSACSASIPPTLASLSSASSSRGEAAEEDEATTAGAADAEFAAAVEVGVVRRVLAGEMGALEARCERLGVAAAREHHAREQAHQATRHLAAAEARGEARRAELDELRASLRSREAQAASHQAQLATRPTTPLVPPAPPSLLSLSPSRAPLPIAPPALPVTNESGGEGGTRGAGGADGLAVQLEASAVEVARLQLELTSARAQASRLGTQLAEVEEQRAQAAAEAAEMAEVQARLQRAEQAREAAERAASSAERECELLRRGADGDETFEAVVAQDLQAMRKAYEAKLAAAQQATRDAQLAHRSEVRMLQEGAAAGSRTPRAR